MCTWNYPGGIYLVDAMFSCCRDVCRVAVTNNLLLR